MIVLEPISCENALVFKAARLRALQDSPTAFGSTYADALQLTDIDWQKRAADCNTDATRGYLAIDAGVVCGMIRSSPDDREANIVWVESMWVAPSHRRCGIGRLLFESLLIWATNKGMRMLKLGVTSNNETAIAFYKQLGFSITDNIGPYQNDPALFEYEMVRVLE